MNLTAALALSAGLGWITYRALDKLVSTNTTSGGSMEQLVKLLNDLATSIDALKAQLVDAQVAAQANYDAGFAAGVASVGGGDKLFTQADLDKAVADAVAPLNVSIAALQAQIDAVPAQIADAVSAAKAKLKALVVAAYDEAQSAEGAVEGSLREKLAGL